MSLVFNKESLTNGNIHHKNQWKDVLSQRKIAANQQKHLLDMHGNMLTGDDFKKNLIFSEMNTPAVSEMAANKGVMAVNQGIPTLDFWREIDAEIIRVVDNDEGRGIMAAIPSSSISIGRTAKLYNIEGDIDGNVKRSMDLQVDIQKDNIDYEQDGDPIPAFQAGCGVNYRQWTGNMLENIDIARDSIARKTIKVVSNMADYILDGDTNIKAGGYEGQGLRNHRNVQKINLGSTAGGAAIDLTAESTTNDQIMDFFVIYFQTILNDNFINKIDKMFISPAMNRRFTKPYSTAQGFKGGTLKDYIMNTGLIGDIEVSYKLNKGADGLQNGNEFICFNTNSQTISMPTAMSVSTVAVPRVMPYDNYNYVIMAAAGLQVKRKEGGDGVGKFAAFYAANLD